MENRKPLIIVIINVLLGVSWALVALGALVAYNHSQQMGIVTSVIMSFFGMLSGFVFVVIFEMCLLQYEKLQEAKKQTKLLEDIKNKIENKEQQTLPHVDNNIEIDIDKLSHN